MEEDGGLGGGDGSRRPLYERRPVREKRPVLLTVSDCPLRGESLPAQERQTGFTRMMEVALELA